MPTGAKARVQSATLVGTITSASSQTRMVMYPGDGYVERARVKILCEIQVVFPSEQLEKIVPRSSAGGVFEGVLVSTGSPAADGAERVRPVFEAHSFTATTFACQRDLDMPDAPQMTSIARAALGTAR